MSKNTNRTEQLCTFNLADWSVDTSTNRIIQGDTEIKLEAKVMTVLTYLASRSGELVTREELEEVIWKDTVVGYDALTNCITKLRKALSDSSRHPRFIETVSKKGYRLIAPVTRSSSKTTIGSEVNPIHSRWKAWLSGLVIVAGICVVLIASLYNSTDHIDILPEQLNQPSIVVLQFGNLGSNPEQRYFSDGITADITTALSKLSGLFVIAPSSAMNYTTQSMDIKQVASELEVRYILEGSVRRSGNKLRINAQLIDGHTGIHLWAERYDREMKDVFDVQDDITAKIVTALSIKLTEEEKRRTAHRYTSSIRAYDIFLHGQSEYAHHTRVDNKHARELFQHAIDLDPDFARAYGAMALTHLDDYRYQWTVEPSTSLANALDLANKAVSIDNNLPQAYWVVGHVHLFRREHQQAVESVQRSIELNPNYADSYATLSWIRLYHEDSATSIGLIRKAMRLNPHYPAPYASALGQAYYYRNQYEDAVSALRDAIDRNSNLLPAYVYLIATLGQLGKIDEADWAATQLRSLAPAFTVENVTEMFPFKDQTRKQEIVDQLRRAGL